jgi:hypothetical protein
MGSAAGDHEQVPDAVRMGEAGVEHVEDDAYGIEQSSSHESCEPGWLQRVQQLKHSRQSHPAHQEIDNR